MRLCSPQVSGFFFSCIFPARRKLQSSLQLSKKTTAAASLPSIEEDDCQSAIWRLLLLLVQLLFFGRSSWCNLEKHRRLVWSQVWPFYFLFFFFFLLLSLTRALIPTTCLFFFLPSGLVPHSPFFLSIISGPHRWISFCFHPLVGPLVVFLSIDVPTDVGFIGGHRWWLEKCGARKHGKKMIHQRGPPERFNRIPSNGKFWFYWCPICLWWNLFFSFLIKVDHWIR